MCVLYNNVYAQTDLTVGDLTVPTLISPYYFGPNAFPVPDLPECVAAEDVRVELTANHYNGFQMDQTTDVSLKLRVPLFTDRATLTIWMPIVECWENTLERQRTCRLQDHAIMRGVEAGDVYISTDILLLRAERHRIDANLRAAVKTASGNGFATARYYDCPGYFFDVTIARPISLAGIFFKEIRLAANAGFLCWQTDNGRQNDAVMYGAMLNLHCKILTFKETLSGYSGWENNASRFPEIDAGDCPMTLKTDIILHNRLFDVLFRYQYGLNDWPFHHFSLGIAFDFKCREKL